MLVTWRSLSPIFADVVTSPWNLLVGGVLITHLSFFNSVVAIVGGYTILIAVFILYGGLGFSRREQSSDVIADVFGGKFALIAVPLLLAIGQIGWAAINLDLGGHSLSTLLSLPPTAGVLVYAIALLVTTGLSLNRMASVKLFITVSTVLLMLYMLLEKLPELSVSAMLSFVPTEPFSLFWGISIVVASLISFATVTPDFFKDVKTRKDVVLSSVFGLLPGAGTALLGCVLFYGSSSLNLLALFTLTTIPLFAHFFNVVSNTDGSTALYTPALKFQSLFKIDFRTGIVLAGGIAFALAVLNIAVHIEVWLSTLAFLFPAIISICFAVILLSQSPLDQIHRKHVQLAALLSFAIALSTVWYVPPSVILLAVPLLFFSFCAAYYKLGSNVY